MWERGGEARAGRTQHTQNRVRAQTPGTCCNSDCQCCLFLLLSSLPSQQLRGLAYPPPKNNLNIKNSYNRQSCSLNITSKLRAGVDSSKIMGYHIWFSSSANKELLSHRNSSHYSAALPKQAFEDSASLHWAIPCFTVHNTVELAERLVGTFHLSTNQGEKITVP